MDASTRRSDSDIARFYSLRRRDFVLFLIVYRLLKWQTFCRTRRRLEADLTTDTPTTAN